MPLVPQNIKELAPYREGKNIEEIERELDLAHIYNLASNENPLGPSPLAMDAIKKSLADSSRYPDVSGYELRSKLAERFDLKIDNVVLGAGSQGIMATILRTFLLPDDEIITAANSFMGFAFLARASGRRVHWVPMMDNRYDLETMATYINEYTKIIYLANPDNPMGTYFTIEEFDAFKEKVPDRVLIIMDEAYFEFAQHLPDYPDSMGFRYANVITLRTFSKAYGLAGIRIGYAFARDELISNLLKVKRPFEPSTVALIAGSAALEDAAHVEKTVELTHRGLEYFYGAFHQLGVNHLKSAANFVTAVMHSPEYVEQVCLKVLEKGVILRHLKPFGWPKCFRISVGLPEENEKCFEALESVLQM